MSLANEILRTGFSPHSENNGFSRGDQTSSQHLVQDTITPYKICVFALVRLYLENKNGCETSSIEFSEEERRTLMLLFVELIKVPDMSFNQLSIRMKSCEVSPRLVEEFNALVLQLANGGPCEYFSFFDRLNEPIKNHLERDISEFTILNRTSVIGIGVRSMLVAFKMMSLEEVISSVMRVFSEYCKEIVRHDGHNSLLSTASNKKPVPSKWQSERRITQLAHMLEHKTKDLSNPVEVHEELLALLKTYPSLHRIHFVMYMNYMRVKEYAGAKDCLHRYFDKMAEAGPQSGSEDYNMCFRYASLNMASLYARFGHREMALHSVREAVRSAQEVNDKACLHHALVWLEHLAESSNAHGVTSSHGLPDPSLNCTVVNTLKYTPPTELPYKVFSELAKALSHRTKYLPSSLQGSLRLASNVSQMTLCSSLWAYYGRRHMSSLVSSNVINATSSHTSKGHCAEPECLALCVLSNHYFNQGDYQSSESILSIARQSFARPYPLSEVWNKVEQCQLADRAFYHADTQAMSLACENLLSLDPVEANLRRVRLYCIQNHHQRALDAVKQILSADELKAQSYASLELLARSMIELINIYCELEDYSSATKYVVDCIQITSSNHLSYQHALCQLYAAHIQLMSNNAEEGFNIIREYLPFFLINGSCLDKGRAQLLYTKCRIARVKSQTEDVMQEVITEGLKLLEKARSNFEHCEAFIYLKDVLTYMALLCNMVGKRELRNQYAYQHKQIELKLSVNSSHTQFSYTI
ncbi:ida [Bugula neritina]|uniref:Anaphase-promoting complex subunit 5 n=1 Tax=Bugula neritina TaxID=10212 RepID=A0A7J7IVI9_BUGNE|nr:ida [Bugula neritina]